MSLQPVDTRGKRTFMPEVPQQVRIFECQPGKLVTETISSETRFDARQQTQLQSPSIDNRSIKS